MLIYPDACVVIYLVEEHPSLYPRIDATLRNTDGAGIAISELTRLECRVRPMRQGDAMLLARFNRFFDNPRHHQVAATREVFELATVLRVRHGLKTPDALHLAAALTAGCEEFWTSDRRLERAAGDKIRLVTFFEQTSNG